MNKKNLKQELMDLDRQFCTDASNNKEVGWASYFAEDAIMVTGGHHPNIIGKNNIQDAMKGLYEIEDLSFIWEPTSAIVSDDGTMGITYGNYTRTYTYNDKHIREIGKYTTVWNKINDEWKITLDTGNVTREEN